MNNIPIKNLINLSFTSGEIDRIKKAIDILPKIPSKFKIYGFNCSGEIVEFPSLKRD